jgi:hypothetical protein
MLLTLLVCIAFFGRDIPQWEDWYLVAPLLGREPNLLAWSWSQISEHRLPLPRLVYLGLLRLSGGDFRAAMVFNTVATATIAAFLVRASQRARGRLALSDSFFPLALLHLGHWTNLIWGWGIQFVSSVCLFGALLAWVVTKRGAPLSGATTLVPGLALLLLPLCGANGLLLTPPLAAWLMYEALRQARSGEPGAHRSAVVLTLFVVANFVIVGLYFVGYESSPWNPPSPGLAVTVRTSVKLAAMGFGPGAATSWRLSVLLAAGTLLVAGWSLAHAPARRGAEASNPAVPLLSLAMAAVLLTLAMGAGRAGLYSSWIPDRYALLSAPVLCVAYMVYGCLCPMPLARWGQRALFAGTLLYLPANTVMGFEIGEEYRDRMDRLARDVAAGVPVPRLAKEHRAFLLHWDEAGLERGLSMLEESHLGPFRGARRGGRGIGGP